MFDLIIIGQDISTAVAALAASRQGLKTVCIREGSAELFLNHGGYHFPADQTPVTGLGQGQLVLRLLTEWGLSLEEAPPLIAMDPAFQIVLNDHRVDLFRSREALMADLARELPDDAEAVSLWYRRTDKELPRIERWLAEMAPMPQQGFGPALQGLLRMVLNLAGSRSLTRGRALGTDAWQRLLEAHLVMLSGLEHPQGPWPLAAAYLFALPQRGIQYPVGGRSALMDWILKGFVRAGGLLLDGSVMRIESGASFAVALEKSDQPIEVVGRQIIVSAQWEKLPLLLLDRKACRRLLRRMNQSAANGFPFCLQIGVHQEGLPESLAPYAVVIGDQSKPASGLNAVVVESSLPGEPGRAPDGRRAIQVKAFLDTSPLRLSDDELKDKAMNMLNALDGLLPFLRDSIDYLNIDQSIAFSRLVQEAATRKYRFGRLPLRGLKTFSPKTPVERCFLTGGLLRAGLGFEGEVLSGLDALSCCLRKA